MIVVDSSVWIALFRGDQTPSVHKLQAIADTNDILVADIVLLEVLQGARGDKHSQYLETRLRTFRVVSVLNDSIAVAAARNYRSLRSLAYTTRKTPDLILASYCIAEGHELLHNDRDFAPFVMHLGLRVH